MPATKQTAKPVQGELFEAFPHPAPDAVNKGIAGTPPENTPASTTGMDPQGLGFLGADGTEAVHTTHIVGHVEVPVHTHEYWTARQRQGGRIHEISYRACFKPQLPRHFIEQLTKPGGLVYDPFMGRGTTVIEAALLGRRVAGCDINPLSIVLTRPRLSPPTLKEISDRLGAIDLGQPGEEPVDLLAFYHPGTLRQIGALRRHLMEREALGALDPVDDWIRMVAVNRLTGHSPGFFSVYSMPPNQAVSVRAQLKINEKRNQTPPFREIVPIILKKSKSLLSDLDEATRAAMAHQAREALLLTATAAATPQIGDDSVDLVVTSPPFLDVVQYASDNWLRCWFCGIDASKVEVTQASTLKTWSAAMNDVLKELFRLLKPGGHVAFEVGEIHQGATCLDETVLPHGIQAGFDPVCVMINAQDFTKTANCWGVENGTKGTNTNRIVVLRKP